MSVFPKVTGRLLSSLLKGPNKSVIVSTIKAKSFKPALYKVATGVAVGCGGYSVLKEDNGSFKYVVSLLKPGLVLAKAKAEPIKAKVETTAGGCGSGGGCVQGGACGKPIQTNCCNSQCNITAPPTMYSLFLWISLDPSANPRCVAKVAADIECLIESVTTPCDDPCEAVTAGVGFGPNFFNQTYGKTCRNYYYTHRKGKNGELPAVSGDILLHAKCNNMGKLFDLCKNYICSFPEGSIAEFEDIYGFDFRGGRDLSGFYDCRTNRCDDVGRREVAIECETGGSYALAQKWIHDFCVIRPENQAALEKYVGRAMECGKELKTKANSSHVARMTGTMDPCPCPQYEIVRHSQNYGTLATDAGQFFLAFAKDPCAFEFMLDRMVGAGCDDGCCDIMKISKCVKGAYWYFPASHELCNLVNCNPC